MIFISGRDVFSIVSTLGLRLIPVDSLSCSIRVGKDLDNLHNYKYTEVYLLGPEYTDCTEQSQTYLDILHIREANSHALPQLLWAPKNWNISEISLAIPLATLHDIPTTLLTCPRTCPSNPARLLTKSSKNLLNYSSIWSFHLTIRKTSRPARRLCKHMTSISLALPYIDVSLSRGTMDGYLFNKWLRHSIVLNYQ